MSSDTSSPAHPAAIQRFWDKSLAVLRRYGIKPQAEIHGESVQGRRLTEHRPADVLGYLAGLGRLGGMEDRQLLMLYGNC